MKHALFASGLSLIFFMGVDAKTYVVTSLNDSGSGTLREAIGLCEAGDVIEFDSGLSGTIQLASSLPQISIASLTITGHSGLAIDGNALYRIFDVQAGPFSVSDLTLLNGAHSLQGGALYVGSVVVATARNLLVTPSSGDEGKNPIFVDANACVDLNDVAFTSQNASHIFLNAATLNLLAQGPLSYLIDGTLESSFFKYGQARVEVSPPPLTDPGYTMGVMEGVLSFSGTTTSLCIVYPGGELEGNFSASGVSNLGVLEPGTAAEMGTIEITGDFYAVNGMMEIKLDPSGLADQVQAEGNIFLTGGTLQLLPLPGTYLQGTKFYSFLTAEGGINGTFATISSGGLDVQVNYYPTFIELEILSTVIIQ